MEGLIFLIAASVILVFMVRRTKRKAREAQSDRSSTPPSSPSTRPTSRPTHSASEPGNLVFVYEDDQGNLSTREVSNWNASARYIKGFCLSREALRTFRRDRIAEFLDGEHLLDTGATPTATPGPRKDRPLEILFTGFGAESREELEEEADLEGLKVRKSLTKNLDFLCAGPNAGPRKLAEARERGATVLSEEEFLAFLNTGALPD